MWNLLFWKAVAERSISTTAQTALALVGVDLTKYLELDYVHIGAVSLIAGGLSVLKSLATAVGSDGSPSLGSFEKLK